MDDILNKGFLDIDIEPGFDFKTEIAKLKKEKNAILLAHYYQTGDIQDIADFTGDSLQLSQKAADNNADIILFAGVHFMAETAKILSPDKKVLVPDLKAGCSLADSIKAEDFIKFKEEYLGHIVISYVNTTAEIKALSDVICTSSNAVKIVESFPKDQKIIFTPDRNLGNYINSKTGRNMVVWDGACHVHEQFSVEGIIKLKKENPDAKIISHPECQKPVLLISDYIGSTAALLDFSVKDLNQKYIVATESGILHQMQKFSPNKVFIPAPPIDSTCGCNDCNFMKLNTLKKIYIALKYEKPEITIPKEIIEKAVKPILRMLEISASK
jgi:quinolinate synthase